MCTPEIISEVERRTIAAFGASFRKATSSPFGAKDEIGMLNLIDAKSRDAISTRRTRPRSSTSLSIISLVCRVSTRPAIRVTRSG